MKCLINGRIVLPDRILTDSMILFDRSIQAILPADATRTDLEYIDAEGLYIAPGLIDVHSHGCVGEDATTSDEEGIHKMCVSVTSNGVTSWLPTTMTYALGPLQAAFDRLRVCKKRSTEDACWNGAQILGINMEGPYINVVRKGAHDPQYIIPADISFVEPYSDLIRLMTIAPEIDGHMDAIRYLSEHTDIRCSVGHTDATYEEAMAAFDAGASEVTHLFNAMTGIVHRSPGVTGAGLTRRDVYTELIADTYHIHKGLFQMIVDAKGDHLVLITDSMRAADMPDGVYDLGGLTVYVEGIHCLLEDGTIAGSVLRLNQAVRNLYENTDLPFYKAIGCASLNPACAIGVQDRKGSIKAGKDADLIVVDEKMKIYKTYVGGNLCYVNQSYSRDCL